MTPIQTIAIIQNDGGSNGGVARASRRLANAFRSQLGPEVRVLEWSLWGKEQAILAGRPALAWLVAQRFGMASKAARLDLPGQRRAVKHLRQHVPDHDCSILVAMDVLSAQILAAAGYKHARTLAQFHNSFQALSSGRDLARFLAAGTRLDRLVMLTPEDAAELARVGGHAAHAPNCLDWSPAEPKSALSRGRRAVAAGRLVPAKNFLRLIDAWQTVHKHHPDWRLDVFGEGQQLGELRDATSRAGLSDVVTFRGHSHNLKFELAAADLLVLTSDYEGLPLVIIEAFSQGTPVVATDCSPGVRRQLTESEAGWLVESNSDAVAAGVQAAIEAPAVWAERSSAAINYAQLFSPARITDAWLAIFRRIER